MRSLRTRRRRTAVEWLAAALTAAASLWLAVGLFGARDRPALLVFSVAAVVAAATLFFRVGSGRERAAVSLLAGILLASGAVFGALIVFIVAGSCHDDGHIGWYAWTLGGLVSLGIGTWSLHGARRTWWGLPAAVLAGAVVVSLVATLATGSTGACLE